MPNEELISEYIDQAAFKAQTDFAIGEIGRLRVAYNSLAESKANIQSSSSLTDISAGTRKADQDAKALIQTQKQLEAATKKAAAEQLKQAKIHAEATNDFKQLTKAVSDAELKYKN